MSYALRPDPFAQVSQTIDRVFDDEQNEWSPVEEPARNSVKLAKQWLLSGYQKCAQGDLLGAIDDCDKATEFNPDDPLNWCIWTLRGNSLSDLGRHEEAIASYDKAVEFKRDYHEAWSNRGISLDDLDRYEEAIASYDKAIKFKPDFHEAWSGRGISLNNLGRNEEAIASYDKAIEFRPDLHGAWYNRGIAAASSRSSSPYPFPSFSTNVLPTCTTNIPNSASAATRGKLQASSSV